MGRLEGEKGGHVARAGECSMHAPAPKAGAAPAPAPKAGAVAPGAAPKPPKLKAAEGEGTLMSRQAIGGHEEGETRGVGTWRHRVVDSQSSARLASARSPATFLHVHPPRLSLLLVVRIATPRPLAPCIASLAHASVPGAARAPLPARCVVGLYICDLDRKRCVLSFNLNKNTAGSRPSALAVLRVRWLM